MIDSDAFLPPSLVLNTAESSGTPRENVTAHLMPFSIAYNGPAPVDTYFIMRSPEASSVATMPVSTQDKFNPEASEEASASFRGRYLHGKKMQLPDNYKISFFQVGSHHGTSSESAEKLSDNKVPVVRAPVRGSRFSLDEDEDEDAGVDPTPRFFDEPEFPGSAPSKPCEYSLSPVYSTNTSFWIWNPDGPIDAGGDPFIQTCDEWLLKVAPAVSELLRLT